MADYIIFTPAWLILVIVYVLITTINLYAVYLYRKAYYIMKRTLMIKSVYFLLIALLFENIYFTLTAILQGFGHPIGFLLQSPPLWAIPKAILAVGLVYFIYASLCPTIEIRPPKKNCK